MNPDEPDRQEPDPDQTIRHRFPRSAQPPRQGPPEAPLTRRLPYTPDMLPPVRHYEARPPRSAWWWVIVTGGLVLLIAVLAVAVVLWVRGTAAESPPAPSRTVTLGLGPTP
ncbi:MAG TPA: hypothetical protein VFV66_13340 [Nonomuraea sp.]|nr:hypothetical protein [Nonomuraea sp.]